MKICIPNYLDTTVDMDGTEIEVRVIYDYQPKELATSTYPGTEASLKITAVWFSDVGDLFSYFSAEEVAALEETTLVHVERYIAEQSEMRSGVSVH